MRPRPMTRKKCLIWMKLGMPIPEALNLLSHNSEAPETPLKQVISTVKDSRPPLEVTCVEQLPKQSDTPSDCEHFPNMFDRFR